MGTFVGRSDYVVERSEDVVRITSENPELQMSAERSEHTSEVPLSTSEGPQMSMGRDERILLPLRTSVVYH